MSGSAFLHSVPMVVDAFRLHGIARERERSRQLEARHCIHRIGEDDASRVEDQFSTERERPPFKFTARRGTFSQKRPAGSRPLVPVVLSPEDVEGVTSTICDPQPPAAWTPFRRMARFGPMVQIAPLWSTICVAGEPWCRLATCRGTLVPETSSWIRSTGTSCSQSGACRGCISSRQSATPTRRLRGHHSGGWQDRADGPDRPLWSTMRLMGNRGAVWRRAGERWSRNVQLDPVHWAPFFSVPRT